MPLRGNALPPPGELNKAIKRSPHHTIQDVAEAMDRSYSHVTKVLQGRKSSAPLRRRIAEWCEENLALGYRASVFVDDFVSEGRPRVEVVIGMHWDDRPARVELEPHVAAQLAVQLREAADRAHAAARDSTEEDGGK